MSRFPALPAVLLLILLVLMSSPVSAQDYTSRVTDYLYASHIETTPFNEIIWFYQGDAIFGPIRSNDAFGIKNTPAFFDEVVQHAPAFVQGSGFNPEFMGPEPFFEAPILEQLADPHTLDSLALSAMASGTYYHNNQDEWQTRIQAREQGWLLLQWSVGVPYPADGEFYTADIIPYSFGTAIVVEGNLEVFGDRVRGVMTVACTGEMTLIDNIMYAGYSTRSLNFPTNPDPRARENAPVALDMLGLVAGGDILIGNTVANGRGNGATIGAVNDHSNKHIIITAAMFSEQGSFSFENQNNRPDDPNGWDGYFWCDPNGEHANVPDERGKMYLHGTVAFRQRGYVHRSNCGGTGYDKQMLFDHRFRGGDFPGVKRANIVDVSEDVTWQDTVVTLSSADERIILSGDGTLTLGPGTELNINTRSRDWQYAFWGGRVEFAGSEENPVRVIVSGPIANSDFRLFQSTWIGEEWSHVIFEGLGATMPVPPVLTDVTFNATYGFTLVPSQLGRVLTIDQCRFVGTTVCDPKMEISSMTNSVIEGSFKGSVTDVEGCTFVFRRPNHDDTALVMTESTYAVNEERDVRNTVFVGEYENLLSQPYYSSFDYNAWYGAEPLTFEAGIFVGDHVIAEQDPLFWNLEGGDFHLMPGSPLIDAGDPASELDPDGTRADIGAFPFDPTYTEAPEVDPESGLPMAFGIENLYPNPFNGMTTISLTLPFTRPVDVAVYDVLGRRVLQVHEGVMQAGRKSMSINLAQQPSGLYFITARAGSNQVVAKAMLVK